MTASLHDLVEQRLALHDQLYTSGRRTIVETLSKAGRPITLPEILEHAATLTQSSGYRNLAIMESLGVVRRLTYATDHAFFELAGDLTTHHHHLICRTCGTIRDITLTAELERSLDQAITRLARREGFQPEDHDIDVYGTCDTCAD